MVPLVYCQKINTKNVTKHLLRTKFYSVFNPAGYMHLKYSDKLTKLTKMQHKALKVINFQSSDLPNGLLYQENRFIKIVDLIKMLLS